MDDAVSMTHHPNRALIDVSTKTTMAILKSSALYRSLLLSSLALPSPAFILTLSSPFGRVVSREATKMSTEPGLLVSKNVQETLDPCVVLMKNMVQEYTPLWKDKGGVYSLAQGVVYWEPPVSVTSSLQNALVDPELSKILHTYGPDEGLIQLRSTLQEKLARENGLTNHDVMITAGANQAYMNCILTLLQQGQQCVVFQPYYFNHVMAIQLAVGNEGLLVGNCSPDGVPDLDWLEEQLESPSNSIQVVTITNPGNPTGVSLSHSVLSRAVDLCKKHKKWLVLDCTYEHFDHVSENKQEFPCFEDDHVLHVFSFSKGYAMAGYRCGYVVTSQANPDLYEQMLKVQDTIPICPSRISQVAALGALEAGRDWVLDQVSTLDVGRKAILQALEPLEQIMGGTGAMYVMGQLPEDNNKDQEVARWLVEEFGVAVIPGSFCGFPGWIRVCYSNLPPEECQIAAERLAAGIREICNKK